VLDELSRAAAQQQQECIDWVNALQVQPWRCGGLALWWPLAH